MKKNISIIVAIAAIIFVSIEGCKKPGTVQNYSAYTVNSLTALKAVSANTYANLRSEDLFGWGYLVGPFAVGEHIAQEYGTMNLIDDNGTLPRNFPDPTEEYVSHTWDGLYNGVSSANAALAAADFYQNHYPTAQGEIQDINYVRGESYFLRAWYYFQLESFYGQQYINMGDSSGFNITTLGVPLFTSQVQSLDSTIQPRATAWQVWSLIISDLKKAIPLLPSTPDGERASLWAAEGLLGKTYVFTQQWDSAEKYLGNVIQYSGKSLMTFGDYQQSFNNYIPSRGYQLTNYGPQKDLQNGDNDESLFEIFVKRVPGNGGYGIFGSAPNQYLGTSMGLFWAPSGFSDSPDTIASMSGRANVFFNDRNLYRFGFTIPADSVTGTALLANQSPPDPSLAIGKYTPSAWYVQNSNALRHNANPQLEADPRLYVCALEPYMDTVYFSADATGLYPASDRRKRLVAPYGPLASAGLRYAAWSFKKYQTLDANLLESDVEETDGADYYLLRLADIYLLEAEALMNKPGGPYAGSYTALQYINAVHRKAYGYGGSGYPGDLTSTSPVDYSGTNDATKADQPSSLSNPIPDVNLAHNPLAYERFVELFAEGHWWFDVGRWGNSTNSANAGGLYNTNFGKNEALYYGNLFPNNQPSYWAAKAVYCYPIPYSELSANAKIRAQANGGQNTPYN